MSKYYPKILFIENKVGRIVHKYKNRTKKFKKRQKSIRSQFAVEQKRKVKEIEARLQKSVRKVEAVESLYRVEKIKREKRFRGQRMREFHNNNVAHTRWTRLGPYTANTASIRAKQNNQPLKYPKIYY